MAEIGYFLSGEEHGPNALLEQAKGAEAHGFSSVWISDHFHPWLDEQGSSPFVWGVIGAIAATTSLQVTTAVTCPTMRIHPAIVAQAAATASLQLDGRFRLGVGTGEALNEHVLGDRWPGADERIDQLREAIEVMRKLWTGEQLSFEGDHYVVDRARLYDHPTETIPVPISAFGPKALDLAIEVGDGFVTASPDGDSRQRYQDEGGTGPTMAGVKVCWGADEDEAAKLAHHLWRNEGVPGELAQELPMPGHFAQASELVTVEAIKDSHACGPDPERHVEILKEYLDAGFDEVYVNQIGPDQEGFFEFFESEVRPRL
ncbi:TIGR03557 family F420-dependent LLM class oxidoreductase [Aquihabitans sp. G128]|uniref:TIGR03557 family F420-dependent LLM class oxidoreductase n=1 Tax=Aquihabitans sp. G128 TaxID=2849779 RepID=UPI001C235C6E|nr:TIGR03557 family F420-dependent LLM class oxidoreductase [Aquihabitans sp. G128]QXC62210.1 TIGR03557 family F420-dependent LLM class oxidoreductase [Aquihabitans sp. G128]